VIPTLATILELTDQVQTAIDAGNWQRAGELEAERRAQLERLVAENGAGEPGSELRTALEQLLERNQRLIGEVHHHRRRVFRDAETVKTGRSAVNAYAAAAEL
jgi:hypothetical protein